jgi:hypothetical protein
MVCLACFFGSNALGQGLSSIGEVIDKLPSETLERASASGQPIASLRQLDSLEPRGRHRLVLPLARVEAKSSAQRLRDALESIKILDEVDAMIEDRVRHVSTAAEQASAQGDRRSRDRWGSQAVGLGAVLQPMRDRSQEGGRNGTVETIRIARAAEPLGLLAWNSGAYSVATTSHFRIASQAGDRPTSEMAQACELAYEVWSHLFADRLSSEQNDAPKSRGSVRRDPFRVVMFRTRDAYIKALRSIEPKISISTGYYSPRHRMSFFYWDGAKSFPTLVHELTHQFFQEWSGDEPAFDADNSPGFWAIEGVALYVESLSIQKIGGAMVVDVGGWDAPRLQAGRYRRLHDEFWVPWEEFSRFDGQTFRNSNEIAAWYSQACGLVHRWLDGSEQDFERFVEYLNAVYGGRGVDAASILAADDDTMRSGYDRYLMESWKGSEGGESRPFFANRREAVLSRCEVASSDLLAWPIEYRSMDWLDLSFSHVDDRWLLDWGDSPWRVVRLNLESTGTTDAAMKSIASMKDLRELDLTQCKITDAGIAELRAHPNLRQLWLGNTQITDASIPTLLSLPSLERLTVEGSGISEAGWKAILSKKPFLKR